jgi:hypothetical protein
MKPNPSLENRSAATVFAGAAFGAGRRGVGGAQDPMTCFTPISRRRICSAAS